MADKVNSDASGVKQGEAVDSNGGKYVLGQ